MSVLIGTEGGNIVRLCVVAFTMFYVLLYRFKGKNNELNEFNELQSKANPIQVRHATPVQNAMTSMSIICYYLSLNDQGINQAMTTSALASDIMREGTNVIRSEKRLRGVKVAIANGGDVTLFVLIGMIQGPHTKTRTSEKVSKDNLELQIDGKSFSHFEFFLVGDIQVVTNRATAIQVFSASIRLRTQGVRFSAIFSSSGNRIVVFRVAIGRCRRLSTNPKETSVANFRVQRLDHPTRRFGSKCEQVICVSRRTDAVTRRIFRLAASFRRTTNSVRKRFFLMDVDFVLLTNFSGPARVNSQSHVLAALRLASMLVRNRRANTPYLRHEIRTDAFSFFLCCRAVICWVGNCDSHEGTSYNSFNYLFFLEFPRILGRTNSLLQHVGFLRFRPSHDRGFFFRAAQDPCPCPRPFVNDLEKEFQGVGRHRFNGARNSFYQCGLCFFVVRGGFSLGVLVRCGYAVFFNVVRKVQRLFCGGAEGATGASTGHVCLSHRASKRHVFMV